MVPIAIIGVGSTLLAGISAVLYREQRRVRSLLAAAFALGAIGSLVTIFFNIPINERLATWNSKALPPDYQVYQSQRRHSTENDRDSARASVIAAAFCCRRCRRLLAITQQSR